MTAMARCIIHIGMHRTGSSSIQGSMAGFTDDRFHYGRLDTTPNHSLAIYSLFAEDPGRNHLHKAARRDAAAVRAYTDAMSVALERTIAEARGRILLISGEGICGLKRAELRELRRYFGRHFDDLSIVGYVRPPAAFMASAFQQRLKNRSQASFDLARGYRSYERTFEKFDDVFGRENVCLWKYDPKAFPGGCVVRDFCSRLAISLPAEKIVRLNESFSRQVMALLYAHRKYGNEHDPAMSARQLASLLTGINHDKFRFSPDAVCPVLAKNRDDIQWMEARLGQSLHEELGQHQPGDIRDEADLLRPDPVVAGNIIEMLGDQAPEGVTGDTAEQVAQLVNALHTQFVKHRSKQRNSGRKSTPAR
jgi:hypothetical protein